MRTITHEDVVRPSDDRPQTAPATRAAMDAPATSLAHPARVPPLELAGDRLGASTTWAREYGDVVPLRFGPLPAMLVTGPDATMQVVATKRHAFAPPPVLRQMRCTFGDRVSVASGPAQHRRGRIAGQALQPGRIAAYGERMVAETERALRRWRPHDRRDIGAEMANLTLTIVARTFLDADVERDVPALEDTMATVRRELDADTNSLAPPPDWVPTPGNLRLRGATQRLDAIIDRLLTKTRAAGPGADHLLALLMHARADDGDRLSSRELRDEAVTFFLAGHETTAVLLAWTFALLARHPDVRAELEAELDAVLGGRAPTVADIGTLAVTGRVLRETLRLYPPAYAFARRATAHVEVGGVPIEKGTTVVVSPWVTQRDPRLFARPEVFDPDRWIGDLERRLPPFAYLPFGGRPHRCSGAQFAVLGATLVLATIAQRYRLDLDPSVRLAPAPSITLRPRDRLWAAVVPVGGGPPAPWTLGSHASV